MIEKPAEVRHLEHEEFGRKIDDLAKQVHDSEEEMSDFIVRQLDSENNFRLELLKEVRGIERSIASKCEQDSAIIATQNRELQRLDRVETDCHETAQALAVVTENMRSLKEDTDKSLTAAHDAIRGHGKRIDHLEKKPGKTALKILYGGLGVAATALITWLVTRFAEGATR